ncbi:MAG: hypothetical protein FJ009_19930 [Chloroflexi bacterium]|nr:hypothetical protein [Chloroflexota bacterium]
MPREAELFDLTNGNVVDAYFLLREEGKNIPPAWIDRASYTRKRKEKELGKALKADSLDAVVLMKDWETAYRKECFYYGIRVLLELERHGKTKL